MNIGFVKFDSNNFEQCELISKWKNDPEIRFLLDWHKDEQASRTVSTPEIVKQRSQTVPPPGMFGERYMIVCEERFVGDVHFCIGAPQAVTKNAVVAWMGIGIGEKSFQGKGLGRKAMLFIEECARKHGAEIFELGVFEFNLRAKALYESLGYKEVTRIQNFTWFDNKMWADIRMTKFAN